MGNLVYFLPLSIILALVLAFYAWRHRTVPGARPFVYSLGFLLIWCFGSIMEVAVPDLAGKIIWNNIKFIGVIFIPVTWIEMVLEYIGRKPSQLRLLVWLLIIPVTTLVFVWTNPLRSFLWSDVSIESLGQLSTLRKTYHFWFWIHTFYSYGLLSVSIVLLTAYYRKVPRYYKGQVLALLVGMLLPIGWNIVVLTRLVPYTGLDLTPHFYTISCAIVLWGLMRYRLFDLTPVARDLVMENMSEGVIILDEHGRVIDLNQAARDIFDWSNQNVISRPAAEVFSRCPAMVTLASSPGLNQIDLSVYKNGIPTYYDARKSAMTDHDGQVAGQLIIMMDVTLRRRIEEELQRLSTTDPLTGLANRRKFFETLTLEMERARRYSFNLSLIILDADKFKYINDTFGHQTGDDTLITIAGVLQESLRSSDLAVRLGGDEFLVLLPQTGITDARNTARRIQNRIHQIQIEGGMNLSVTVGLTCLHEDDPKPEVMLARADRALYRAKRAGGGGLSEL